MSWKYVFNGSNVNGRTICEIAMIAYNSGYEFFTFNGEVYFCTEGQLYKTKLSIKDLV